MSKGESAKERVERKYSKEELKRIAKHGSGLAEKAAGRMWLKELYPEEYERITEE